ncbi:MAG: hypothetical protein H5U40_06775, partial [Polyangiaceae bacterium]|nr:hypothetical protein [Polyangiaceae bacterium]
MMRALALLALLAGLGFLALGAHIALFGSERPLAHDATRLEGKVLPGRSTDSPAGEPFLYGRVRIRSANRDGKSLMHVDRTFGDPGVRVETEGGTRTVRLPAPDEWRVTRDHDDIGTIPSLHDIPLLAAEDVRRLGETIPPPYEVNVRAIRADN